MTENPLMVLCLKGVLRLLMNVQFVVDKNIFSFKDDDLIFYRHGWFLGIISGCIYVL